MSEQFILDNDSFEQDLDSNLNPDSFQKRRAIRNSKRGKSKAIAAGKRRVKKAQSALKRIRGRLR